jgi:hypothetical protein
VRRSEETTPSAAHASLAPLANANAAPEQDVPIANVNEDHHYGTSTPASKETGTVRCSNFMRRFQTAESPSLH